MQVRWLTSPLVSFTPHAAAGGLLVTAAAAGLRRPRVALTAGVLTGELVRRVWPRTQPGRPPAGPHQTEPLKLMSVNLFQGRFDADALVALVREHQPDVLALQELRGGSDRRLQHAGLFALLPHRSLQGSRRLNDNGVFSRFPIRAHDEQLASVFHAVDLQLPTGRTLAVLSVHPMPPTKRGFQARWVALLAMLPAARGPFATGVILGDFNATLDHAELQGVLARGWRDAAQATGRGLVPTWRGVRAMRPLRLTIDHILVSRGTLVQDYVVRPMLGSDHRAVIATVRLPLNPTTS